MTEHQVNFSEQLAGLQEELAIYATFPGAASANHVQTLALALIAASLATIAERSAPARTPATTEQRLEQLQLQIDRLFNFTVNGPGASDIENQLARMQNQIDQLFSVT